MRNFSVVSQAFTNRWITTASVDTISNSLLELKARWGDAAAPRIPSKNQIEELLPCMFQEIGVGTWSFSHNIWRAFLNAHFFARCLELGTTRPLGCYGFSPLETLIAMELVEARGKVDEVLEQIPQMVVHGSSFQSDGERLYALGNLVAAAVWSYQGRFAGDLADCWIQLLDTRNEGQESMILQIFLLNALSYRIQLSNAGVSERTVPQRDVDKFRDLCERRISGTQSLVLSSHAAAIHKSLYGTSDFEFPDPNELLIAVEHQISVRPGFDTTNTAQLKSMQKSFAILLDDPKDDDDYFLFRRIPSAFYFGVPTRVSSTRMVNE